MGFFDSVLTDEQTSTTTTTQGQGGSTSDDGGFLILGDDSNITTPLAPVEIKAEDIPDSAISFLDVTSIDAPVVSEDVTILGETRTDEGFSLFGDNGESLAVEETPLITTSEEVETKEESVTILEDSISIEETPVVSESISFDTPILASEEIQEPVSFEALAEEVETPNLMSALIPETNGMEKADPYSILDKAIEDLQILLTGHAAIRNEKMATVEKINDQISTLKQEAKKLTEEAKDISSEEEKVNKMIDTFKAQKV